MGNEPGSLGRAANILTAEYFGPRPLPSHFAHTLHFSLLSLLRSSFQIAFQFAACILLYDSLLNAVPTGTTDPCM